MRLYHMDFKVSMYKPDYIKKWFGKLKANGFNGVVIEIDNKLRFPSCPDFAAADALSASEWNDIIRYGKGQGLVIYPLLQTLGHMEHILGKGTTYTCLAENPGNIYMLCPSKEGTFKLIKSLMLDLYEVFDRPKRIHLGGDEVYSHMNTKGINKCPLCMPHEPDRLLIGYLVKLAETSLEIGMRPEFWADEVLAFPQYLDKFPKETKFVDWNYRRTVQYGNRVGVIWGTNGLVDKDALDIAEKLPSGLRGILPYLITKNGEFNHFYGADYIKSRGYEVIIASAVRSCGDCYAVPRIETIIRNTGISEVASVELECDHLVTSWAVRLSHPETTWPGLNSKDPTQANRPNEVTSSLGDIDREALLFLNEAGKGMLNIDIPIEDNMRFQRPYYDNYCKTVYDIWKSDRQNEVRDAIQKRILAGESSLSILRGKLNEGKGDNDCLRHWINGIELCMLRSEQVIVILDSYSNRLKSKRMKQLLEMNLELMTRFEKLWDESVTEYSLAQEKEVKFKRDIKIVENMICK